MEKKSGKRKAVDEAQTESPEPSEAPEAKEEGKEDEDASAPVWPLNSRHLMAGDLALILYDGRMLDVKVQVVSTETLTFHMRRTQLKDIDYPWSEVTHPTRTIQAAYSKRFSNKEMKFLENDDKRKYAIELRWRQSDPPLAVFGISRTDGTTRQVVSFWKQFRAHIPKLGDHLYVIPQGIRYSDSSLSQQKPTIQMKRAQVTKVHESGLIRLSYTGPSTQDDDEFDIVYQHTLLCWKCTKPGTCEPLPEGFEFTTPT